MCLGISKTGKQCGAKVSGYCWRHADQEKKQDVDLSIQVEQVIDSEIVSSNIASIQTEDPEKIMTPRVEINKSYTNTVENIKIGAENNKVEHMSDLFDSLFDMTTGSPRFENLETISGKFEESFDRNKLAFILNNLQSIIQEYRPNARNALPLDKYFLASSSAEDSRGSISVFYKQDPELHGRYNAIKSLSAQNMVREVRGTIFEDYYVDMDIDNAHPVFTVWLCNKLGISCTAMAEYVQNREDCLFELMELNPGMTRDAAKQIFLSINYGGNKNYSEVKAKTAFLKRYKKEAATIQLEVGSKLSYFKAISDARRKASNNDFNLEGSAMSHICCFIENQVLMRIVKYLENKIGYDAVHRSVLSFDGVMIPKESFSDSFMPDLENLFERMGLPIKFSVKPFKPIDLSGKYGYVSTIQYSFAQTDDFDTEEALDYNTFPEDDYYMADFLKKLCGTTWVSGGSEALEYLKENFPRVGALIGNEIIYKSSKAEYFNTRKLTGFMPHMIRFKNPDTNSINSFEAWKFINANRHHLREFRSISADFNFDEPDRSVFICSRRFIAQPIVDYETEKLKVLLEFIKESIFSQNEEMYEYELDKLAIMLKYPHKKTMVITILLSNAHGCGKNLYTDFLCKYVFGEYNCISNMPGIDALISDKNAEQIGKKLIVVGEMANESGKFRSNFDKLKGKITEKSQRFRPLYSNGFMVDSATEYYALSNHKNSFYIESVDSRREFLPDINESHKDDREYFGPIKAAIENQACGNAFYSMLMARPITYNQFTSRKVPFSNTKSEVVQSSKSLEQVFIDELLQEEPSVIYGSDLYARYCSWMVGNARGTTPKSMVKLAEILKKNNFGKRRDNKGMKYYFPGEFIAE